MKQGTYQLCLSNKLVLTGKLSIWESKYILDYLQIYT